MMIYVNGFNYPQIRKIITNYLVDTFMTTRTDSNHFALYMKEKHNVDIEIEPNSLLGSFYIPEEQLNWLLLKC